MTTNITAKLLGFTTNAAAKKTEIVIEIDSANPQDIAMTVAHIFRKDIPAETTDEPAPYDAQSEVVPKAPRPKSKTGIAWTEPELKVLASAESAQRACVLYSRHSGEDWYIYRTKESIKSRWQKLRRAGELDLQRCTLKLDQKVRVKVLGELREGRVTKTIMNEVGETEYLITSGQTKIWLPREEIEVI
jgi:hypothetical protein